MTENHRGHSLSTYQNSRNLTPFPSYAHMYTYYEPPSCVCTSFQMIPRISKGEFLNTVYTKLNTKLMAKAFLSPVIWNFGVYFAAYFDNSSTLLQITWSTEYELISKRTATPFAAFALCSLFLLPVLFSYVLLMPCIHLFLLYMETIGCRTSVGMLLG